VTDAGELTASRTSRFAARAYRKALDRPGGGECANGLGLLGSRRDRYRDSSAGPPKDEPHHAPGPHRGNDESANGSAPRGRRAGTRHKSTAAATSAFTESAFSWKSV
jgi:hypothetical protein